MDISPASTENLQLVKSATAPLLALIPKIELLKAHIETFLPVQHQLPLEAVLQLTHIAGQVEKIAISHRTLCDRAVLLKKVDYEGIAEMQQLIANLAKAVLDFSCAIEVIRGQVKRRVRLATPYLGAVSTRLH